MSAVLHEMFNDDHSMPDAVLTGHTHPHTHSHTHTSPLILTLIPEVLTGLSFELRTPQQFEHWSEGHSGEKLNLFIQT